MIDEIERLAKEAQSWVEKDGQWPDAKTVYEATSLFSSDDCAYIASMSPDIALKFVALYRAAKLALEGANKQHWDAFNAALKALEEA